MEKTSSIAGIVTFLLFCFPCLALSQATSPYIVWDSSAPLTFPTPLSDNQYRVRVLAGAPVAVSLAPFYNVAGITTSGTPFNNGGFDDSGWSFSEELLGRSITWQGISFPIGPPNAYDVVTSEQITLPAGHFATLLMLGDLVNGEQPPTAHFVVTYTDGSTASFDQSLSDWVIPRNYPGESLVDCMPNRHLLDGSNDVNSVCVYGYQFTLDPARTVQSITLPQDRNVLALAMALVPPPAPGTLAFNPGEGTVLPSGIHPLSVTYTPVNPALFQTASASQPVTVYPPAPPIVPSLTWPAPKPVAPGTPLSSTQLNASASIAEGPVSVRLAPYYRVNALYTDGSHYLERGFDGSSTAFSSTQLGPSLTYAGAVFPLGPSAVPDAAADDTIALPAGNYTSLLLLGAAGTQAEQAQTFTITYTDGTATHANLSLSAWRQPQYFAGESIVAHTTEGNKSDGSQLAGTYDVYGYQIALNPAKTVQSLTLPPNPDVILLAAALNPGISVPVPGTFTYTPAAGFIPAASGTLSTHFTPADSVDLTSADATVPFSIGILDFSLSALNGTVLTAHTGDSPAFTFRVAPTAGTYASALTFTLTGALPPLAIVTFSPASISAIAGEQLVVLTIHTRTLTGETRGLSPGSAMSLGIVASTLFLLPLGGRRLRISRRLLALGIIFVLLPVGCGSGYHDAVYPLTLTATDGVTQHSIQVTLHIEASPQ